MEVQLESLCNSLSPEEKLPTIHTLLKIVQNALDHPGIEQYRRLRTENKTFNQRVWRHPLAQEFMKTIGWILIEDMIVLPSDDFLQDALIELTKAKSILDEEVVPLQSTGTGTTVPERTVNKDSEYKERMKELKEMHFKAREEKERILERIKSSRQETNQREARPSHGRQITFGANLNRFKDIGVDLNAGGG